MCGFEPRTFLFFSFKKSAKTSADQIREYTVHCYTDVLFQRLESVWHSINMRPPSVKVTNEEDCLQFTKVYFKKIRAKKERLLQKADRILLLSTHHSYLEQCGALLHYTVIACCFGFLWCLFPNVFYLYLNQSKGSQTRCTNPLYLFIQQNQKDFMLQKNMELLRR